MRILVLLGARRDVEVDGEMPVSERTSFRVPVTHVAQTSSKRLGAATALRIYQSHQLVLHFTLLMSMGGAG